MTFDANNRLINLFFNTQKEFGLQLPKWTEKYFPERLQDLTDKSYVYNAYNSILKRLKGGVFVKKAIKDWNNRNIKQKILIYAGHDSSVTNILSAFNVWTQQFPDYGSAAHLLFKNHVSILLIFIRCNRYLGILTKQSRWNLWSRNLFEKF